MPFSAQHIKAARLHLMQSGASMKKVIQSVGPFTGRMIPDERLTGLADATDEEAMAQLLAMEIPPEEAERLLFFSLGRLDILPASDPLFKTAVDEFATNGPAADQNRPDTDSWRPYRSFAGWYLQQWYASQQSGEVAD